MYVRPSSHVVQHGMPLAERAALAVLPAQANAIALHRPGWRSASASAAAQSSGRSPAAISRRVLQQPLDLGMRMEVGRQPRQRLQQLRQPRTVDRRARPASALRLRARRDSRPRCRWAVGSAARYLSLRANVELRLQPLLAALGDPVRLLARHAAQLQQVLQVALAHRLALLDRLVQQRLREATARRLRCGRGGGSSTCR